MAKDSYKHRMTLEKLAVMTQHELLSMDKKIEDMRENMATKDDIRKGTVDVLRAVDKIAVQFDKAEKDHAADKLLHDRHEKRLEKLEAKIL